MLPWSVSAIAVIPLVGDALRHIADAAQPVEQAELRVMKVDEVAAGLYSGHE
jgi:hypothetical protein